ncbi:MAG: hypothetical protein HeimC3_33000 [Candidatus Heimdallarchaeota archaeon LC_3]|nr:MAG: hypothetical protein HeimC3_33000 [Candidatus Heimdallarchaeota archaeon LC_3]
MVENKKEFVSLRNKSVYFKVHLTFEKKIIAFADPDLIGKTFKDKEKNVSLSVNPSFYQGELITIPEGLELIKSYPNCNIVGSLAYYAVKLGIAHKHSLLWIIDREKKKRVPHLLMIRI